MVNSCERCGESTINPENDYCEFVCDECEQNAVSGLGIASARTSTAAPIPLTIREQHIKAWEKFK